MTLLDPPRIRPSCPIPGDFSRVLLVGPFQDFRLVVLVELVLVELESAALDRDQRLRSCVPEEMVQPMLTGF